MPKVSFFYKVIRTLLALAGGTVALAVAYGWAIGEVLNGLFLGLFPAAFLIVMAVLLSLFSCCQYTHAPRAGWLIISILALMVAYLFCNRSIEDAFKDGETLLIYLMLILSFPLGLLAPFFIAKTAVMLEGANPNIRLTVEWLCFFVIGYLQWFIVLTRVLRKKNNG